MRLFSYNLAINLFCSFAVSICTHLSAQNNDTLAIHWLGHASLYFEFEGKVMHIDPWSTQADYQTLPKADLIFITHQHSDHFDAEAITTLKKDSTLMICTQTVKDAGSYTDSTVVLNNWDSAVFKGIPVKAVPAYNFPPGESHHPEGIGNGYVFTFNELKVYVAGDTEDIDEMSELGKVHIAFIPMNLPYTMTPEQAVHATEMIKPNILYIYHFGNSDTSYFRSLVTDMNIDVRIGESLRYEKTTQLNFPSGLMNQNDLPEIDIFPNPVHDLIYVNNSPPWTTLHIYNEVGNLISNHDLVDGSTTQLDIRHLKSGYYLLRIDGIGFQKLFPLIKL